MSVTGKDWADSDADEILRLIFLPATTRADAVELLAAKFRAVEAVGASRGTEKLAAALRQKLGVTQ
jgi:hypothetical protein